MLGLCTGSLAAAAASSCSTLSELLPAAVQTVQVAFRLGLCVVGMRDRIESLSDNLLQEWSVVFSDLEPNAARNLIDEFCQANVRRVVYRNVESLLTDMGCRSSRRLLNHGLLPLQQSPQLSAARLVR